jgi:predicted Zn-ribbon and HTH transcriptional regulator
MKKKVKEAVIPKGREATVRQNIVSVLRGQILSAREISGEVHVSEKEVLNNLFYIQKTLAKNKNHLIIIPAECRKCGFVFKKRDRFNRPGKCPICRSEMIKEPFFTIK